jgi:DNA polymerase-3 subunit alpha
MVDFVHLHVHSDYSLLDGAAPVEALAAKAASLGMKHLAITDHGNMFGALKFLNACLGDEDHPLKDRAPVHPIIGCEFYIAPDSRLNRKYAREDEKYYHLVLLAAGEQGYRNLMKLASLAYIEGFYMRPRIDKELLEQHHDGLICLSACLVGEIPSLILAGRVKEAEETALWFNRLFGQDNFYLEIQDHGIESQKQVNRVIAEISGRTGIPLVATNDIHYLEREDAIAQDLLLCIGTQDKRGDPKRKFKFEGQEFYFKTGDEMAALFPEYPEAIANTVRIAERCKTEIPRPGPLLPDFDIPQGFANADEYLRHLTLEGLAKRYPGRAAEVAERAEYELGVIIKMGFTGYFLIVADFINWAKEHGIPVGPGRGSGAGSIVAYALRITNIDPLKYNLLFERFLNPERVSMPDFDVDFANEGRAEVIKYVTEKYGQNRVGQIVTFGTLKAKAAIRDVARALDISLDEANMIAKLIPDDPRMTLKRAFEQEARLRELEQDARYQELFALARKLEGKNRNSSIHAAGVVIGKTDLTDYVPLYRDHKDEIVASQYTMDVIEPRGLVKMDFLGLKTLDIIKHTEELIRLRGGKYADFDIEKIPESNAAEADAAYKMLGEGKSFGVFQFESEGMQKILRDAQPSSIAELTALNALYRPGPMDNIPQFIDSKWGRKPIVYPHPSLEEILKETYGVIVYQEQVMQVAQIIAGFTLGHADELRRAMGKKKMSVMVKEKEQFIAGAAGRGIAAADAGRIFDMLIPFAGYGFNKSHAAAYSVVAYQTAFLKANFPVEFMAANMTNEINSVDKLPQYIEEARRMGIAIDPPDINKSDRLFTVAEGRIVYGFMGIKGVGEGPADEIIACRGDGPYKSFMDFLDRVSIKTAGKKVIELLIKTGAFDGFGHTRQTLLLNLETAVDHAQGKKADKELGQASLFEDSQAYPEYQFAIHNELDRMELLNIEQELIGFYFSGHPMDDYKDAWEKFVKLNLSQAEDAPERDYTLIGIVKSLKPYTNKNGKTMAFGSLSDYRGEIDLVFFEKPWEESRDKIAVGDIIALKGRLDKQRGSPSLRVDSVLAPDRLKIKSELQDYCAAGNPLDDYAEAWEQFVKLDLAAPEKAPEEEYTLIGMLSSIRPVTTKNGKDMAFASLSDFKGEIDLVFFPRAWEFSRDKVLENRCVAVKGRLDKSRGKPSFQVSSALDAAKLKRKAAKLSGETAPADNTAVSYQELHIRLDKATAEREENLFPLRDYLYGASGPCPVFIHVPVTETELVIRAASQIGASADASSIEALALCAGVAEVWPE